MDYKAKWDRLTEAQRKLLKHLAWREQQPEFEFIGHDGIRKTTALALKSKRMVDYVRGVLKLTDLGRAVYEANTAPDAEYDWRSLDDLTPGEQVFTQGITLTPDGTTGTFVGWSGYGRYEGSGGYARVDLGERDGVRGIQWIHLSGLRRMGLRPIDDLKAQLAAAQERERVLRAALYEIINRAPDEKPVHDSDYDWDNLEEGRERGIASSAHVYGEDMAWWYAADIARKALSEK